MDNAAKALTIAGGFLVGMLVITLSMYFLTQFRTMYESNAQLHTAYEINAFNSYFTRYEGIITGSDAYNILSRASEVNSDAHSMVPFIDTNAGNVTATNYVDYFYFTEKFTKLFNYSYSFNAEGLVSRIVINAK